jgi:2-keto-4-pentenoate hydratase
MPLDDAILNGLAEQLRIAEATLQPIHPLTEAHPDLSPEDGYRIQSLNIAHRVGAGQTIVGRKIATTSKAMQAIMGVHEPTCGTMMDTMVMSESVILERARFTLPRAEAEILFVLGEDLRGPGITPSRVLQATAGVMACLEIADTRIADWKVKLADSVADNTAAKGVVLGGVLVPVSGLDLRLLGMVFEVNGEVTAMATGAAIMGHPARAMAWLANKLAESGQGLKKGDLVMSGALHASVDAHAGTVVQATFDRLGSVRVKFE